MDKLWTHAVVAAAGVPVPAHASVATPAELDASDLPADFPLFVKPRWEGTAKGIGPASRVDDPQALRAAVEHVTRRYAQPALVEAFLPGAEYTVTVVGTPARALPVLQRAIETRTGIGAHALERHADQAPPGGWRHATPGSLDRALEERLVDLAVRAHAALECRDFSRSDFRLDASGEPRFLEINPLPTFAPDGSFGILAELEGRPPQELVAEVLGAALRRLELLS